jgi:hypothetical protein
MKSLIPEINKILGASVDPAVAEFHGFYLKNGTRYETKGIILDPMFSFSDVDVSFSCISNLSCKVNSVKYFASNSVSVKYTM